MYSSPNWVGWVHQISFFEAQHMTCFEVMNLQSHEEWPDSCRYTLFLRWIRCFHVTQSNDCLFSCSFSLLKTNPITTCGKIWCFLSWSRSIIWLAINHVVFKEKSTIVNAPNWNHDISWSHWSLELKFSWRDHYFMLFVLIVADFLGCFI